MPIIGQHLGLLYDGWEPIYRAAPRVAVLAKLGGPDGHCDDKPH
jgi:hypothetical protein